MPIKTVYNRSRWMQIVTKCGYDPKAIREYVVKSRRKGK